MRPDLGDPRVSLLDRFVSNEVSRVHLLDDDVVDRFLGRIGIN